MTTFKTKYNRRSFLKLSSAAGGGMLLGFSWLASCNPTAEQIKAMPENWFDINAYLKIGENGLVTIISPNPEIGQNVKTSMPMIIAEELDVSWSDVIVEQAALNTNWYQRQVAGGSQSIRKGWQSLRMAGATARQLLVETAAKRWDVSADGLSVSDGVITNKKGEKLTFGELAEEASKGEVPAEATLKSPKDYKIIGQSKGNVDIDNIITGKPLFGLDYKREGMVYATALRPPAFGQKLVEFDDKAARAVSGVTDVIQFGDKIAVLATSTWAAIKGKKALTAKWEQDTKAENTADHDAQMMAAFGSRKGKEYRSDGDVKKAFAEADELMERVYEAPFLPHNCMEPMNFFAHVTDKGADLHGPIQTPEWTRSQIANLLGYMPEKANEADRKTALEKVKIGMSRMGGGFGRRLYGDFALEAAEVSQKSGKPIKMIFTREDDMTAGTYRPSSKYKMTAAIKDGQLTGYQIEEAAMVQNMYPSFAQNFPAGAINNFRMENHMVESNITIGAWRAPYTNFLASAEQGFFDELAEKLGQDPVDFRLELLENAKKNYKRADDEFGAAFKTATAAVEKEEANLNAAKAEEATTKIAMNEKALEKAKEAKNKIEGKINAIKGSYEPDRIIGVIKLAAEKANWKKEEAGVYKGFSVYFSHNTYVAQVAHIEKVNNIPVVKKVTCVVDCGIVINPNSAKNLIQGGVIDGIGHAMYGDFSFKDGFPQASNFDKFRLIRMNEVPEVEVHFVESEIDPTGLGEPTLPPAGGAIVNALYRATGKRLYKQPYVNEVKVLG
jgi:isoquinoline 1-oxidoreductase beta subunit